MSMRVGRILPSGVVTLTTAATRVDVQEGVEFVYMNADGPLLVHMGSNVDDGQTMPPEGTPGIYRIPQDCAHPIPIIPGVRICVAAQTGTCKASALGIGDYVATPATQACR